HLSLVYALTDDDFPPCPVASTLDGGGERGARYADHAVIVGHDDVSGLYQHTAADDRYVHRAWATLLHMARMDRSRPYRKVQIPQRVRVANAAVRDHSRHTVLERSERDEFRKHRGRRVAAVGEHQDLPGPHELHGLVHEKRVARIAVDRDRLPGNAEAGIER